MLIITPLSKDKQSYSTSRSKITRLQSFKTYSTPDLTFLAGVDSNGNNAVAMYIDTPSFEIAVIRAAQSMGLEFKLDAPLEIKRSDGTGILLAENGDISEL